MTKQPGPRHGVEIRHERQVLWQFAGSAEPANPEGTLAFDSGALFGTSDDDGQGQCFTHAPGCGTVWKLTP